MATCILASRHGCSCSAAIFRYGYYAICTKLAPLIVTYTSARSADFIPVVSQVRTATKKAGGSVKRQNHNRKRKGKRYGPKVDPDELVQPGAILFRQKGFRMHPGRNVDYGKDHTLFALREGHVKITKELVDRPANFEWGEGPYFERTFIHVEERPKVRRITCKNPETLVGLDLN